MDMNLAYDYRETHTTIGKGESYDANFENISWRKYVWGQEKKILDKIISKHFRNEPIEHLDFACGTGRLISHLISKTNRSTGVDVSGAMLQEARKKLNGANFLESDITREGILCDRKFNLITAFRFFPNAQDELRQEAIAALSRHLVENGVLIFNNHKNSSSLLYKLGSLMRKKPRTMSLAEAEKLASSAGLEIIDTYSVGIMPASDNHMLLPRFLHGLIDRIANCFFSLRRLGQNVIFVCRKNRES